MSSIPRGVGAPPPPGMESGGKLMCIKVRLLDDTVAVFHLGHRAVGQTLFDEVCRHLNLLENDYFGLEFIDNDGCHIWLDMEKQILRQISSTTDAKFHLIVKFYTPNPVDLEEEYTRYLFSLQLRRDLSQGHFICAENTSALLCAYLVQAECGDFSPEDYPDPGYLSHTRFIPNQTIHFQQKVMDNHRKLVGLSPEESDLQMLEVARRCDFYGIKFHLAKDVEGTDACLAVTHLGVKVFHQLHCVSTFSWAKIRKLSFKRKKLLIKLHPDSYQYYKETIEFVFESRNECKTFWKKCVEHHAFFRCPTMEAPKKDHRFFTKGSSFRYHGRTQKQLIDYVREHHKRREPFTRPLRSGYHTASAGCSSSGYSAVVRREKSASSSQHAQSDVLPKRQPRIIGLNSTFSDENVHALEYNDLSARRRDRWAQSTSVSSFSQNTSEYGALSMHSINTEMMTSRRLPEYETFKGKCDTKRNTLLISNSDEFETIGVHDDMENEEEGAQSSHSTNLIYVIKDLRSHERAILKDTRIITQLLKPRVWKFVSDYRIIKEFFISIEGISIFVEKFLNDLEESIQRCRTGEEEAACSSLCRLILNSAPKATTVHEQLLRDLPTYISALQQLAVTDERFRQELRAFELSPESYLPTAWILIRILNRILFWQETATRAVEWLLSYSQLQSTSLLSYAREAVDTVAHHVATTADKRRAIYDYAILLEIDSTLDGFTPVTHPQRSLIRVGRADVWCGSEFSARLIVLLSDVVLFTFAVPGARFQAHSLIQMSELVDDGRVSAVNFRGQQCISLQYGSQSTIFTTTSYSLWLEDISSAMEGFARHPPVLSPVCISRNGTAQTSITEPVADVSLPQVCWQRKATISGREWKQLIETTRSGVLLRKLRTSTGWQKLDVLNTNGTLFFFASYKDIAPIARLPLLEYNAGVPALGDHVSHKNCFKIAQGTEQYFFRADSHYSFLLWLECLRKSSNSRRPLDALTALALHL